uniref:Late endosomal/lysosomal adaptor and MAPK and MTOR activator 1 n=1 Tax=Strongyloides stercoralis TaxID=6248 RepID=A0A0K0EEU4_STRER
MTRSLCACCRFLRKDKPISNNQDLEAGVKGEIPNIIPIMLSTESCNLKIKNNNNNNNAKDNVIIINETIKCNNEMFHTARTAREDIVKDYKTMEQLVREIRLDHGIIDTPRLPTIDSTLIEASKINKVENMLSTTVLTVEDKLNETNSILHSKCFKNFTDVESGTSTPDISQISNTRQESGYESCTFEDISLSEGQINDIQMDKDDIVERKASFYGHISTIPQNFYIVISYIYFLFVSTIFKIVKKISG